MLPRWPLTLPWWLLGCESLPPPLPPQQQLRSTQMPPARKGIAMFLNQFSPPSKHFLIYFFKLLLAPDSIPRKRSSRGQANPAGTVVLWTTAGRWPVATTSGKGLQRHCSYLTYSEWFMGKNKPSSIKKKNKKKMQVIFFQQWETFIQVWVLYSSHAHQLPRTPSVVLGVPKLLQDCLH